MMNILITAGRMQGRKFSSRSVDISADGRRVQICIDGYCWEFMVGYECEFIRN